VIQIADHVTQGMHQAHRARQAFSHLHDESEIRIRKGLPAALGCVQLVKLTKGFEVRHEHAARGAGGIQQYVDRPGSGILQLSCGLLREHRQLARLSRIGGFEIDLGDEIRGIGDFGDNALASPAELFSKLDRCVVRRPMQAGHSAMGMSRITSTAIGRGPVTAVTAAFRRQPWCDTSPGDGRSNH
jgi:hypothetical protein